MPLPRRRAAALAVLPLIKGLGGTTTNLDALDVSDVAPGSSDYLQ